MKIDLLKSWDDPNVSSAMTAYNIGMLRIAAETENVKYILAKINELYHAAKSEAGENVRRSNLLIDGVVYNLLRLGRTESDFNGWPTIRGPRPDGVVPDIRNIEIERVHLIKALSLLRKL